MRAPSRRTIVTTTFMMVGAIFAGIAGCHALDRQHLAKMLNIAQVPASVSDIDCAGFGFTDVLERCAFKIAPTEFDALLAGYRYVEPMRCRPGGPAGVLCVDPKAEVQSSHAYCCGPNVGRDFPVARTFVAKPKEFEHGGSVTVLADRSHSSALVDLYIE